MTLTMSSDEADELRRLLDSAHAGLMRELVATDDREYREGLKRRLEMVELLKNRLRFEQAGDAAYG